MALQRHGYVLAFAIALYLGVVALSEGAHAVNTGRNLQVQSLTPKQPYWIGHLIEEPADSACYRRAYVGKPCPRGYDWDGAIACWAQCPLEYPVECGAECLPQNQACLEAVIDKAGVVVTAAMNALSAGVFGQLVATSKAVKLGVDCSKKLFPVVRRIVDFVATSATTGHSQDAQLKKAMAGNDFIVRDLPLAVSVCLDLSPPSSAGPSAKILKVVHLIVDRIIASRVRGEDILTKKSFIEFLHAVGLLSSDRRLLRSVHEEPDMEDGFLDDTLACGRNVKRVVDDIARLIKDVKTVNTSSTVQTIRFAVMNSDLFLRDIPDTVLGCVDVSLPDAVKERDQILKTVYAIVDRLLDAAEDGHGKPKSLGDYTLAIADMGLDVLSRFDPTGLAAMAEEFVQPICGPTIFVNAIDAGPADQALGLRTIQSAFKGSSGQWIRSDAKESSSIVRIAFRSSDDKDVTVHLVSGGNDFGEVDVPARKSVMWSTPLTAVQAKTLYMIRSRSGFLWIKSTGGGSLLTWVPEVLQHNGAAVLNLDVNINAPTPEEEMEAQRQEEAPVDIRPLQHGTRVAIKPKTDRRVNTTVSDHP